MPKKKVGLIPIGKKEVEELDEKYANGLNNYVYTIVHPEVKGEIQIAIINCEFKKVDGYDNYALTYDDVVIMTDTDSNIPEHLDIDREVYQCIEDLAHSFAEMLLEAQIPNQTHLRGN